MYGVQTNQYIVYCILMYINDEHLIYDYVCQIIFGPLEKKRGVGGVME